MSTMQMNVILKYIEFNLSSEIENIDNNAGSLYTELVNGDTYFLMVEKCEKKEKDNDDK